MKLEPLLERLLEGAQPDRRETRFLLTRRGGELRQLCAAARQARERVFGPAVGLYGFIYLSTHCRNDCAFCRCRSSNADLARYRKSAEEVLHIGLRLAGEGVHVLDLTLGEDPRWLGARGFASLCEVVSQLRARTDCAVMVSPGLLDAARLEALAQAGAQWYACYQETHDPALFRRLRPRQDFAARQDARRAATRLGLHAEDGLLVGAGASPELLADAVLHMAGQELRQVRAMRYVPHASTCPPLGTVSGQPGDLRDEPDQELALMAVLRLVMPSRCIPASLDVDGLDGLAARLDAGANVVTSLVPAGEGLRGVASDDLDIDNNRRCAEAVRTALRRQGLRPATREEYQSWLALS